VEAEWHELTVLKPNMWLTSTAYADKKINSAMQPADIAPPKSVTLFFHYIVHTSTYIQVTLNNASDYRANGLLNLTLNPNLSPLVL